MDNRQMVKMHLGQSQVRNGENSPAGYSDPEILISRAESPVQISACRSLFLEYAESLRFSLCFQNFDRELAGLPGDYAPPRGRLLLASYNHNITGCVAMHELGLGICEMKRFYVRPQFRGKGIGHALANAVIADARNIGYRKMRLDTVEPEMKNAVAVYRALGFRDIDAYRPNPIAGALYMEMEL